MSCHRFKVPIKAFQSDDQQWWEFIKICLAGCAYLFVKKFRIVHVITFKDMLLGESGESFIEILFALHFYHEG